MILAWLVSLAFADPIDPRCADIEKPPDYDEQLQRDFMANYFALATTFSPLHGPIPHEPGRGSIGLDLLGVPPLSCERRFALNHTKTEETNRTPVIPRPRATFAFPRLGPVVPYAGLAYVPPVTVLDTRNFLVAAELGAGAEVAQWQVGARFHATSHRTIADIATAFDPEVPPQDDLFLASSLGFDLMAGWPLGDDGPTPYVAVGYTDVSTFFYVGADGTAVNNLHPYSGLAFAAGLDGAAGDHLRWVAELYGAPGGHARPDPSVSTLPDRSYGHLYTGRLRLAWAW